MTKIPEKIVSWKDNHIFQVMMVIIFLTPIYTFLLSTGDIQDDAYIIFRSAFNLADHGQLTFNLGEAHSGATSYLYPLFVALVRTVSGDQAVAVILIVNSIALASPVILKYKRDYPLQWWIEAVKQEKPTFLVQRSRDIVYHRTYQGYQMTPTEAAWFDSQYELIHIFKYRPEEFTDHSFLQWLLRFGSQVDYHVFKLRDSR